MKKKLTENQKTLLIYSGELIIFSIAFIVLGILEIVGVLHIQKRLTLYNWITLFGGCWTLIDFTWLLISKTRRKKNALIDKILSLPVGIFLITFDLICLIGKEQSESFYSISIGVVLLYLACDFLFQAIYHFKHPIPGLLEEENKQTTDENTEEIEK